MHAMVRSLVGLVILLADATPALADDDVPAMVTLERGDRHTRVGIDTSYIANEYHSPYRSARRVEVHAQVLHPSGFGVAMSRAYARSWGAFCDDYECWERMGAGGNTEVSALYANPRGTYVLRAGLVVGTARRATYGGDDSETTTRALAAAARIGDAGIVEPTTYIRVVASRLARRGRWYLRVDGGLDLGFDADVSYHYDTPDDDQGEIGLRAGLGFGVVLGPIAIASESTAALVDTGGIGTAISVRARHRPLFMEPYVAVGGAYAASVFGFQARWFVTGGVQFRP